jgi:hypothetical protein
MRAIAERRGGLGEIVASAPALATIRPEHVKPPKLAM